MSYAIVERPHVVYRCYDADDRLLYIGCTSNLSHRMTAHRSRSPWATDIARITTEDLPGRAVALYVEAQAIRAESPLHNKVHNLDPTIPEGVYNSQMVIEQTGISYRQLDYWCRQGWLTPSVLDGHGSGNRRLFSADDVKTTRGLAEAAEIVAWVNDGSIWERVRNGQVWKVDVAPHGAEVEAVA